MANIAKRSRPSEVLKDIMVHSKLKLGRKPEQFLYFFDPVILPLPKSCFTADVI